MKRLAVAIVLALVVLARPAAAGSRADATTLTFFYVKTTAEMTTLRDALLWYYDGQSLGGLLATAARPNIALTSVGGGNSELAISMALAQGNTWVNGYAARFCPGVSTTTEKRACANTAIRGELIRIWDEYQKSIATPPPAAPDI